jgi:hypothetical protein
VCLQQAQAAAEIPARHGASPETNRSHGTKSGAIFGPGKQIPRRIDATTKVLRIAAPSGPLAACASVHVPQNVR